MNEIREITNAEADDILNSGDDGNREPRGVFIIPRTKEGFLAIDNSDGYAWAEVFGTREQAEYWLQHPSLHADDVDLAMKEEQGRGCPFCDEFGERRCQDPIDAQRTPRSGSLWNFKIYPEKGLLEAVDVNDEPLASADINFCPMCGRELEEFFGGGGNA